MSQPVVLLTAAVSPSPVVPFTALDQSQRLGLYLDAFKEWRAICAESGMRLCVVETTGASADLLELTANERELFVAHRPDPALEPLGKGALESSAMDAGMAFVSDAIGPNATVHKVTGKLRVPNWRKVLLPQAANTLRIRRSMDRSTCDTRVFSSTPLTWSTHFARIFEQTNDVNGIYFEHAVGYRSVVAEFSDREFRVERFAKPPHIVGVSGSDGVAYGGFSKDGLSNALSHVEKHFLEHFQRRMI